MSSSYSTTKLLDPSAKKQRVRIISSKIQPVHRPQRPRFQIVSKSGYKITGKGMIGRVVLETVQRKTIHFQEGIPDQEKPRNLWRTPRARQPSSETKPRRLRTPFTHNSGILKEPLAGPCRKFNVPVEKPQFQLGPDRRLPRDTMVRVPLQRSGFHKEQTSFPISPSGNVVRLTRGAMKIPPSVPVAPRTRPTGGRPVNRYGYDTK